MWACLLLQTLLFFSTDVFAEEMKLSTTQRVPVITAITSSPTHYPTAVPTSVPTTYPTEVPTSVPTTYPTEMPTLAPTTYPTSTPTSSPTVNPTNVPTLTPTVNPTHGPTSVPTSSPTSAPSASLPPPPAIPANYSLWSEASSWTNRAGVKPTVSSDVVIGADMWIYLDESPPFLKSLTVYGKLAFMEGLEEKLTLKANYILNYGFIEVAGLYNGTLVPFDGEVEIVLSGTKSNSLPVMVGESIYTGAKNLVNLGDISMIGKPVLKNWVRLAETVDAGATTARVAAGVAGLETSWQVGDEIVFAPTGYFGKEGKLWSEAGGSVEYRTITAMTALAGNVTEVTLSEALSQGHLCMEKEGTSFCGVVGLMTHNVKISSEGSEDESNSHWGFGGHIVNVDLERERKLSGSVNFYFVQFVNMGKVNSDHYALSFMYTMPHEPSWVEGCSFKDSYNFPLRTIGVNGLVFKENVMTGNIGGGVYIEPDCKDISLLGNVVIGTAQLPSILASSYAWTRPIAGFTIESPDVVVKDNVCAGSVDQGFAVATKYFVTSNRDICDVTKGEAYTYNEDLAEQRGKFDNNEAVGGKVGLMVMAMSPLEVSSTECSIVNGVLAWRNAHVGIQALNAEADTFVADVVLAENHIGVLLDVVQFSKEATTGVIHSTIIGALADDGFSDLPDSNWVRRCHAFTGGDPFALSASCGSVAPTDKRRVGIMVSQFTNRALGCGVDQSLDQCQPPTTPDRACGMPFDKRYGIPVGMQYTEMHVHNVRFTGFKSNMTSGNEQFDAIAVSTNPSQIDATPSLMMSGIEWVGEDIGVMDVPARFGFQYNNVLCESRTCMGLDLLLLTDIDGSAASSGAGLLITGNPGYAAPYPKCRTMSELGQGYIFCAKEDGFREYSAMWKDPYGQFAIGPLIVDRIFEDEGENRSFAIYNSLDDVCAMRFRNNFYKFMLAPGYHHKVRSTGTVPADWQVRWDSPHASDSAVVEFFIHGSNAVRVYVGKGNGIFVEVPRFTDRYPTLSDHAGASARNPQKRTLTVTMRGGEYNWYKFVITPTVSVTMKLEMAFEDFMEDAFVANIALLLDIPSNRIKVVEVTRGSVNAVTIIDPVSTGKTMNSNETFNLTLYDDFTIVPSNATNSSLANTTNSSSSALQLATSEEIAAETAKMIVELTALTQTFAEEIVGGNSNFTKIYNIDTLEVLVPEVIEAIDSEDEDGVFGGDANVTDVNSTAPLSSSTNFGTVMFLISKPPTSQPSGQPSDEPSGRPSGEPSSQPSSPTGQPSSYPTSPTGQPSGQPSGEPSSPTGMPSSLPTLPTGAPISGPSAIPSGEPTSNPTTPTVMPTLSPTSAPTVIPTPSPLLMDDDFQSLDLWELELDGSTASLELVPYAALGLGAAASSTYAASRVEYCGRTCYRSEMKVAEGVRGSVIPSNSGEYWMGFRMRIPEGWVWGGPVSGVTDFTYLLQLRGGDNTGGSPILGLRSMGDALKLNVCGRVGSSSNTECSYVTLDVPVVGGAWMDWVIKIDMQHGGRSGSVAVWVDGENVYSLNGKVTSFADTAPHYLKLGAMQNNWKSGDQLSNSWMGLDVAAVKVGDSAAGYDGVYTGLAGGSRSDLESKSSEESSVYLSSSSIMWYVGSVATLLVGTVLLYWKFFKGDKTLDTSSDFTSVIVTDQFNLDVKTFKTVQEESKAAGEFNVDSFIYMDDSCDSASVSGDDDIDASNNFVINVRDSACDDDEFEF